MSTNEQVAKDCEMDAVLDSVERFINTIAGKAKLVKIIKEDENGKWDDNYYTRDGFYVLHKNPYHIVYEVKHYCEECGKIFSSQEAKAGYVVCEGCQFSRWLKKALRNSVKKLRKKKSEVKT